MKVLLESPAKSDRRAAAGRVLVRARKITKTFGGQHVLDGVSLDVASGDVILLRGPNGCGKTTLLNVLSGNLAPEAGTLELLFDTAPVCLRFPRKWWKNNAVSFSPESFSRKGMGRSWQEVRLFESLSLVDNIAIAGRDQPGEDPRHVLAGSVLRHLPVRLRAALPGPLRRSAQTQEHEKDVQARARARLARLGLADRVDSTAERVSLGQAKRVAISRAVEAGAQVLLLDEPLAGLDDVGAREVLSLLATLAREGAVALVIVEHVFNVQRLVAFATKVWTLENGRLTTEHLDEGCTNTVSASQRVVPDYVRRVGMAAISQPLQGRAVLRRVGGSHQGCDSDPWLEIIDLVVFRRQRLVIGEWKPDGTIAGLSLSLHLGEIGVLQAPNGWGKTTLLEAIAGLVPVTRGVIRVGGNVVHSWECWRRAAAGLGFLRSRDNVFPGLSVRDVLRLSGSIRPHGGIEPLLNRKMSDLSGGERQRVAFECAARPGVKLLLLDEPFSSLDVSGIEDAWNRTRDRSDLACLIAEPLHRDGELS